MAQDLAWLESCPALMREFYAYWRDKCAGRRMPSRADLDPLEFPRILPHIILLDVVADERRYVYRLVGTAEVKFRGYDPTNKSVVEGAYGEPTAIVLRRYDSVVEGRAPIVKSIPHISADGRKEDEATLYLPLSDDGEHVNKIIVLALTRIIN